MATETYLGFMQRGSGHPVRLHHEPSPSGDGTSIFTLAHDGALGPYRSDDPDDLAAVMAGRGDGETPQRPRIGQYREEDLVPVRTYVTTQVEPIDLPAQRTPLVIAAQARAVTSGIACRYIPSVSDLIFGEGTPLLLIIGKLAEDGIDPATLPGRLVDQGSPSYARKRRVLGTAPVPEDYADLFPDGDGVLFVCRHDEAPSRARPSYLADACADAWEEMRARRAAIAAP